MSLFLSDESMANKSQLIKIYLFLVHSSYFTICALIIEDICNNAKKKLFLLPDCEDLAGNFTEMLYVKVMLILKIHRGISQVLNEAHHYFKNLKPTWKILCTKQAIQDNIYLPDAFQQQLTDTPVHSYTHIALTITIPASAIKSDQHRKTSFKLMHMAGEIDAEVDQLSAFKMVKFGSGLSISKDS
ncbi:hypothetical protein T01_12496 [Trichinella spiralis]|uniref:Uncharacterized protein n=1 Tax=Trichinella spiralis TaxID=6334 RepID=A0A0V1BDP4_TRISP|nr:hypothetical protein T01_12496 [Trichinella spiralis]